ncbi:uncharacterized protein LOC135331407 isoform X1 [Halichondria panicea]|uniref:uncharacterized protein LOC135331407 isoform X1 n=1 Tax=Halichondria panicea TaxID=6063 RepID=UPI00312B482F
MVITDFLVLLKLSDSVLKLADSVKESNQLHLDSKVLKNKPNNTYLVEDIKIVEKVPHETFRKPHCFQIGSKEEVMYFCAGSEEHCQLWINAFIKAAFEMRENKREPSYHNGAFGHTMHNSWSCCKQKDRNAEGCESSTACSAHVELQDEDAVSLESLEFNKGINYKPGLLDAATDRHYSIQSAESGYGQSPAISRRGTAVSDSGDQVSKRVSTNLQMDSRDSGLPTSAIITEEDLPIRAESDPILIYTPKNILLSEGGFSYATTVLYRGADSVIVATNTGKVFTSSVNAIDLPKYIIYDTDRQEAVSISVWGKYIAIASTEIYLHNLDDSKGTQCGRTQDSTQLVAFSPDGSLFSASKGRNVVRMWSKPKDWAHVNTSTRPVSTFSVAEEGEQIFGMTVSPHPKNPWLAVVVTSPSSCDGGHGYSVHIYNYSNKHSFQRIDAGLHTSLAFTHDGRHLFIGNKLTIKCLDLDNGKEDVYYTFKRDGSITSLTCSSVRHHLAVGLSTGEVNVFTGHPSEPAAVPHSIPNMKSNGAVTSLSYSRDGINIAVASNDGNATSWRGSKPLKEPVMVRKRPLLVTNKGQTFHSDEDGYTITVPEGAVKEGIEITLHHGVAPHSPYGPFEFDEGVQPVSPILLLCPQPANTVFLKPIEVTLPHFIACETLEDCNKRLSFSKARHDNFRVNNSCKIYQFETVTDGNVVHTVSQEETIRYDAATLYTQHCCFLCIQEEVSEEDTRNACFSLHQIVPRYRNGYNYEVYYCLSYQLETCNKTVDEQFPNKDYIKRRKAVLFEGHQNVLRIQFSTANLPGNWGLQLANTRNQITEGELCFWGDPIKRDIKELCRIGVYPPRIPVRVTCGEFVRGGVFTTISFSGICGRVESVSRDFNLELTKPQPALASLGLDEYEILKDELQDKLYENANTISCERLALALYSESSIQKCPYLAQDSTTRKKIKSFVSIAKPNGCCISLSEDENFRANYAILTEALDIADTIDLHYTKVIKKALELSKSRKDKSGTLTRQSLSVSTLSDPNHQTNDDGSHTVKLDSYAASTRSSDSSDST